MGGARYRRGGIYAADMARYAYLLSEENTNTQEMDRVKLALWRALHEDITEKQRQYLLLYYGEGMNMGQIGRQMGVEIHGLPDHQAGGGAAAAVPAVWGQAVSSR